MTAPLTLQQQEDAYLARLGERVRAWRTEHGMSRKRLAVASGVSERYLAQLEAGQGNISVLLLRKVARAMGVAVERLVREDDTVEKPIALIGLRGAGKSTLGAKLAASLSLPLVELDEGRLERPGELRAERGFAGAAQAEQGDARAARRRVFARELFHRHAHGARHAAQQQHRDVAAPRLELREVALGHARGKRQLPARHVLLVAPGAHALAQTGEVDGFLGFFGKRGVHEL